MRSPVNWIFIFGFCGLAFISVLFLARSNFCDIQAKDRLTTVVLGRDNSPPNDKFIPPSFQVVRFDFDEISFSQFRSTELLTVDRKEDMGPARIWQLEINLRLITTLILWAWWYVSDLQCVIRSSNFNLKQHFKILEWSRWIKSV